MTDSTTPRLTSKQWLIITIASIGFLFDTYELLMTPLVGVPAIAELLGIPRSHPDVTMWMGNLLWLTALCGGVFGLLGGRLIDQFGRKRIMGLSIFVYSFSPFAAAYSTSLEMFIFFRCATFVGVCVEFVAAITWLAEVFEDKKQRGRWLGITQAFASLGGVLVTLVAIWIGNHINDLPHWGLPGVGTAGPDKWRYLLMTGILPAIPIALLLPFVPESRVWKEKKMAGTRSAMRSAPAGRSPGKSAIASSARGRCESGKSMIWRTMSSNCGEVSIRPRSFRSIATVPSASALLTPG